MHIKFEWDAAKAKTNLQKHRISFEDAMSALIDPFALMKQDRIEGGEQRWQTLGMAGGCLVLLVAHLVREDDDGAEIIRIISARAADKKERKSYENQDR